MTRSLEQEKDIKISNNGDEFPTEGDQGVKREKKRKTKEERIKERKIIFWTFLLIFLITLAFWLVPKVGDLFEGKPIMIDGGNGNQAMPAIEKPVNKNYIEITL